MDNNNNNKEFQRLIDQWEISPNFTTADRLLSYYEDHISCLHLLNRDYKTVEEVRLFLSFMVK